MTMSKRIGLAAGIFLFAAAIAVDAGGFGQQYYGNWSYYPSRGYNYCSYNYRPYDSYPNYSHHYCISYPSSPNYVYYYNPYQGQYWGRCDLSNGTYSLLAEGDRRPTIQAIPETAFPTPGQMPLIPPGVDNGKEVPPKGDVRIAPPPAPPLAEGPK
jgi:hypothetical protein